MGDTLSSTEYLQLLDCVRELHRCPSLKAFPEHALRALALVIPSTRASFNEVNVPRGRLVAVNDPPIPNYDRMAAIWERHSGQHPLVRYVVETGDGQAVKMSDFLSERQYHRLELYREVFKVLEVEDQMSVTIRSDRGVIIAVAFNRGRRTFTESDRVKLNLLRPHVLQAYANVKELSGQRDERDDLQTALRETGHGLIALDAEGNAAHATPGAVECLARYLPEPGPMNRVPRPIVDWLHSEREMPFMLHAAAARLIIRRPRHTARRLLLISEEGVQPMPGEARLTARECEVLDWLTEGKSNAEIAGILGVTSGTVKLHVAHILAKLGVANRTAAAALARGGRRDP